MSERLASRVPRHMAPPLLQAPLARGQSKNPVRVAAGKNARHSFSGVSHMPCSMTITGFGSCPPSSGVYTTTGCSSAPTLNQRVEGAFGGVFEEGVLEGALCGAAL